MLFNRFDVDFLCGRLGADEPFFRDDRGRLTKDIFERSLRGTTQGIERMTDIFGLECNALVGQGGEFNENAFRLSNSLGKTIESEFFSAG